MQFDREKLIDRLSSIKHALSENATVPQNKHYWFDKERLYAFNGWLGIALDEPSDLEGGVPDKLLDLLRTSSVDKIELAPKGNSMVLSLGTSHTPLVAMPAEHTQWRFPREAPKGGFSLKLTEELLEAIKRALFIDVSRPTMTVHQGITVDPDTKGLEMYTTDGQSIAQVYITHKCPKGMPRFIMPWSFVNSLKLVAPGGMLYLTDQWISAQSPGVQVFHSLLDLEGAPDFGKIMVDFTEETCEPIQLPERLKEVIKRVVILAGSDEPSVDMAVKKNTLAVTGNYRFGTINEKITFKGDMPEGGGRFLADLVSRGIEKADMFSVSGKSLVLYGGEDFLYVVASQR